MATAPRPRPDPPMKVDVGLFSAVFLRSERCDGYRVHCYRVEQAGKPQAMLALRDDQLEDLKPALVTYAASLAEVGQE